MRDVRLYLEDILQAVEKIAIFLDVQTFEEFLKDEKTSSAVIQKLEIIGEASKGVPDSLKEKYPEIPWKSMAGMRDRLIHSYFGMDVQLIWQTVKEDLPKLKEQVSALLKADDVF